MFCCEWVELYNNGDEATDLAGWEIHDAAGHITEIATTTTMSGSTIIGAEGSGTEWAVVNLDGCILNNTGDTINLFDGSAALIDTQTYTTSLENKSDARIPDGIGAWVDPVPTPGGPNKLVEDVAEVQVAQGAAEEEADADTEAPVLILNGNNPALVQIGATYGDLGATVTDNVNNNLGVYLVEDTVDTSVVGEYKVVYRSTDQAGNDGFVERTVIVYDPADGIPVIEEIEEPVVEEEQVEPVEDVPEVTEQEEDEEVVEAPVAEVSTGGGSEPEAVVEEEEGVEEPIEEEVVEEVPEEDVPEEEVVEEDALEEQDEQIIETGNTEEAPENVDGKQEEAVEEVVEEILEESGGEDQPVVEEVLVVEDADPIIDEEEGVEIKEPEPEPVIEDAEEPVVEEVVVEEIIVEEVEEIVPEEVVEEIVEEVTEEEVLPEENEEA
ncbi:immunoglobulin-like domain-containing protein [Patescibacteria group bacterium]